LRLRLPLRKQLVRPPCAELSQATVVWCASQGGTGSPIVTSTDGKSEVIVWGLGAGLSNRLKGFDGDTGATIFAGGGPAEAMTGLRPKFTTSIAAKGRIFVAGDSAVYAFTVR
jgi:hypothetical protein